MGDLTPEVRREVERWLTKRGLPHLITGYSAREDVLTRTVPFLGFVFVLEVFTSLERDWPVLGNLAAFVGGMALLLGAYASINRLRGRPPWSLPRRLGLPEVATFVLLPPLLPVVFGADLKSAAGTIISNLLILGIAYIVTSYGVIPMVRWSLTQTLRHVVSIGTLAARALPLLLLFTTFLLFNAELWQVVDNLGPATFTATVALFVVIGLYFFFLRVPRQTAEIASFSSWDEVRHRSAGSPAHGLSAPGVELDALPPLGRADRVNVALLLVVTQGVQILLVSALIGVFIFVLGLVAIDTLTVSAWVADPHLIREFTVGGETFEITAELVEVAAFVAAFAGLQFTVSASTDETWRAEFVDDIVAEVRDALAVRALCLGYVAPEAST